MFSLSTQDEQPILCQAQAQAFEFLSRWEAQAPILHLWAGEGMGKTTVLQKLLRQTDGYWVDAKSLVEVAAQKHPFAIEEAVKQVLSEAIENHPLVIVDDFDHFYQYAQNCGEYIRSNYYATVLRTVADHAARKRVRLVLSTAGSLPDDLAGRAWSFPIEDFAIEDYRCLVSNMTGRSWSHLDFDSIHRFAPHMSCRKFIQICRWLSENSETGTEELLEFIRSQGMTSNVDTEEVQDVSLNDLIGVDHIKQALEENIILPMENTQLAIELGLTPKRGVILAGPPGTGKTMVGRALARRLRGKFFLIDGTMISGTDRFYYQVDWIFQQAVQNAPSIVFIDDSDVIFESGREHGLYRYLLTKLDGLESKSASSVCVMLTAMDLGNIPPALVRSGRIELWLETRLPDDDARQELLTRLFSDKVRIADLQCWPALIEQSRGMSGADLKRLVQDAKLKLANDRVKERPVQAFESYLLAAIDDLAVAHEAYVDAAKRAYAVNADRPRWFNVHPQLFER